MSENTANLTEKVLCAAGLVEYQEGSVVSREILKKGTGTVTVFAFDAGSGPERAYCAVRCHGACA